MSHLLHNCDVSRTVRHKRQTDSDNDDDNDQHLSKHLLVQAVIHATDDLEQVNTLLIQSTFTDWPLSCFPAVLHSFTLSVIRVDHVRRGHVTSSMTTTMTTLTMTTTTMTTSTTTMPAHAGKNKAKPAISGPLQTKPEAEIWQKHVQSISRPRFPIRPNSNRGSICNRFGIVREDSWSQKCFV